MTKRINNSKTFFGHPKGLFVLFITEMWERFSFYGMRAILVLYIYSSVAEQGLGWSEKDALWLYGWYTTFVYLMSIPGGLIADQWLGTKKSVLVGGVLLCIGHLIMAIPDSTTFFVALSFIILGVGLLKPNISTMVGELYKELDARRERGFFIFYMGINFGALLATVAVAIIRENFGWHTAFGVAGIGMVIGQIFYVWGQKHLAHVGNFQRSLEPKVASASSHDLVKGVRKFFSDLMANNFALIIGLIGLSIAGYEFVENSPFVGLMILTLVVVVCYFIIVQSKLNMIEKNRMRVLSMIFLVIILFNAGFEQSGGLLNIYTHEKIERSMFGFEIPAEFFQGVNALFIIILAYIVATFWAVRRLKRKESSAIFKIVIGLIILSLAFLFMVGADYESSQTPFGKANMLWIIGFYFVATLGELCVQPVALSFITRLAPRKYASIMMGVFFAITGLGNKLAGYMGEKAHPEHIMVELDSRFKNHNAIPQDFINKDEMFDLHANIYRNEAGDMVLQHFETGQEFTNIIKMDTHSVRLINKFLEFNNATKENMFHTRLDFHKDLDWKNSTMNKVGDGFHYIAEMEIEEMESKYQYQVFLILFLLLLLFGVILLLFLKTLKKLTHGAEDIREPKEIQDKMHGEILE